jgi:hypothetical protein
VAVHAFGALVRTKWKEWDEGRGRAAKARKQKERVQRERQAELLRWLQDLDLDELHPLLVREGVDLTTLQYIAEDDLSRLGVTQLGQRRKLLAAVRTQEQYKHLTEKLATLEAERITLMQEHARQGHPLLPVLQVAAPGVLPAAAAAEIDAELTGNPTADADALLALVARVLDRRHTPVANAQGNVDFQLTRGELGLTT